MRHFEPGPGVRYADRAADLYPTLNAVRIGAEPRWDEGGAALHVTLDHCLPWFDRYEVRFDGSAWEFIEGTFDWPMREGMRLGRRLRVRPHAAEALALPGSRARPAAPRRRRRSDVPRGHARHGSDLRADSHSSLARSGVARGAEIWDARSLV